jgi:uncharacterized protein (DUF4415 family)
MAAAASACRGQHGARRTLEMRGTDACCRGPAPEPPAGRQLTQCPIQRSVGTHQRARLDPDVVAEFRYAGPGWQSRINVQLRHTPGFEEAPKRAA